MSNILLLSDLIPANKLNNQRDIFRSLTLLIMCSRRHLVFPFGGCICSPSATLCGGWCLQSFDQRVRLNHQDSFPQSSSTLKDVDWRTVAQFAMLSRRKKARPTYYRLVQEMEVGFAVMMLYRDQQMDKSCSTLISGSSRPNPIFGPLPETTNLSSIFCAASALSTDSPYPQLLPPHAIQALMTSHFRTIHHPSSRRCFLCSSKPTSPHSRRWIPMLSLKAIFRCLL
ncbi:hypothetical protein DL96DRAFT_588152 [Flagelloscypha sp. PMI_526]|nr:hypothetical protein DL96DRAFT_588152 [Flagelloscypha sp. PMI_526]